MMSRQARRQSARQAFLGLVLLGACLATAAPAAGFTVLHTFTGGAGGSLPRAGLILDDAGNLYGTTWQGGSSNYGTVFTVRIDGTGFTVLHHFEGLEGEADGIGPVASLILDGAGNLYGTTANGSLGTGTVFALKTDGTGFTVLHKFARGDGHIPWASLILDGAGNLYGTTGYGGSSNLGTVFTVKTDGTGFTVLHSFSGGTDGSSPYASLILDGAGNLYGTTTSIGSSGAGTIFTMKTDGTGFTVLHNFTGGAGGSTPYAGLILDGAGNLYGTTGGGGSSGLGTVFALKTDGTGFTVLHSFTHGNGHMPWASLILDDADNLYGTTFYDGSSADSPGTVFTVKTDGTGFTVLRSLSGNSYASLILDGAGNLYGTTYRRGSAGHGTVFTLASQPVPPPDPTGLNQLRTGGVTAIPVGGTTPETTVVFRGTVSDPGGRPVRLQIELRSLATAFTGAVTHQSALVASGSAAAINVAGLANGGYHWQARTVNSQGDSSAWVAFGGNLESAADFTVANTAPTLAFTGEAGYTSDGVEPSAGRPTTSFTFRVKYSDADGHAPQAGSPMVHITLGSGSPIAGSPFAMTFVSGTPAAGALYTYSRALAAGSRYTYRFEARDTRGAAATGSPTGSQTGPTLVPDVEAFLTSPTPGSVLPGASASFTWSAGTGATQYFLYVGTTRGDNDVYAGSQGLALSRTVNNLPGGSVPLYVRLFTRVGETWEHSDYTFTAMSAPNAPKATLTGPTPESVLPGTSASFTWSAGSGATEYYLYVGTKRGRKDVYAQSQGLALSRTVNNLPGGSVPVYVRLLTRLGGTWQFIDYTFTAMSAPNAPRALLTSPAAGSVLPGTSVTFTWSAATGSTEYRLHVGTTRGGKDVYGQSQGLALSRTVSNLPRSSVLLYVRLLTLRGGEMRQYTDYTFTAAP